MRFLMPSLLVLLPTAAAAAALQGAPAVKTPPPKHAASCPRATSHYAYKQGEPLKPRKLTELPSARGYMAVYRVINGCEEPMTMIEYRTGKKR